MKRYIALLRGVNVGGKNKISMAELKQGFEALGLTEVRTHLNSGNVVFSGDEGEQVARIQAMPSRAEKRSPLAMTGMESVRTSSATAS